MTNSDIAHALVPWLGLMLAAQGPIVDLATTLGATEKTLAVIGAVAGLAGVLYSKQIDSTYNARITAAESMAGPHV